jgi:hypothetical protein
MKLHDAIADVLRSSRFSLCVSPAPPAAPGSLAPASQALLIFFEDIHSADIFAFRLLFSDAWLSD